MNKINRLSSNVYNRIAAGEVVERPASVIKEVVENAIDAGADSITIEIVDGGITSMVVTDNGCGMEIPDLKLAPVAHCTSKISTLRDLDNISTLGFRGEALSSIASVSKLRIVSKTREQEVGAFIRVEGGSFYDVKECGASDGTEVTVNNLFFNTPVREKFLKSIRSEENEITAVVTRFILGNYNIAFKYIVDGKIALQSFGDGFESAFSRVYGVDLINDCYKIDTVKNGITVKGYIGKQYYYKGNRSYQTVFLNGRYISNQTVASAISNAYGPYLMKRQYPFYVLEINVPIEEVDVNVHPSKADVRFSDNQIVYGSIYSVVSKVLDGSSDALYIVTNQPKPVEMPVQQTEKSTTTVQNKIPDPMDETGFIENYEIYKRGRNSALQFSDNAPSIKVNNFDIESNRDEGYIDIFSQNKAYLEKLEREKQQKQQQLQDNFVMTQGEFKIEKDFKYIGQVLNTYLVLEDGEGVYFVDQHAAHERLLFDKFCNAYKENKFEIQTLLLPYVFTVNSEECDFLQSKLEVLNGMGIEIEEFGTRTFKVSSIPVFLQDLDFKRFFFDLFDELDELRVIDTVSLLKEKIAQKACKSAIKSGNKLTDKEVEIIVDAVKKNPGIKCPHGRPVVIKITRTEIDKWFKRIL